MNDPISPTPSGQGTSSPSVATLSAAPATLLAEVYVYVGQELLAKYSIEHGEYLIGRDGGCHIAIDAERISRHHARLTFNSYELVIEDLSSANGVFIEGVQVQLPTRLQAEQELQIGSARLFVKLNDATARQLSDSLWDADLGLAPVRQQLEGRKYKALTTIARGGMGVILQARDLRIRRNVAMKVMKAGAQFSRESVLRFIDEAQLTGQLEHPNIVPVYELAIDDNGETFYTMKFVRGITLDEVLRGLRHGRREMVENYTLASLITIFQKVCDGVAFAHSKGVIHRDLKPENIMIGSYGEVLVMDWGLAKQLSGAQRVESRVETALDARPRDPLRGFETMHGVVVGTPPYISPEQARGELDAIDVRSDVYVLGAILYVILSLRSTVNAESVEDVLTEIIAGRVTPPVQFNRTPRPKKGAAPDPALVALPHCPNQRIPEGLSAIAMKGLRLEPGERYQTVEEMQREITAYQGGFATKAERANWFRRGLLLLGRHKRESLIVVGFVLVMQILLVSFIVSLSRERNAALKNAQRARQSETELADAINELRGTAPTFAQEATNLIEDQRMEEALDKIDYAIDQVPNEANYHLLRGNILQSMLRFAESSLSYEAALQRNPQLKAAKDNLALNKKLTEQIGDDGSVTPSILRQLQQALLSQKRVGEALTVLDAIGRDKELFFNTWRAAFEKRGLRQRFETKEDQTLFVDLSKMALPDLRKVRAAPVSGINLDDTRVADLSALRGLKLQTLSLSHTLVRDLTPLAGMPLKVLNLDSTLVANLASLNRLPLENLRLSSTRVEDLGPLRGIKLEQLNLSGCRGVRDLKALASMPLEKLDLSRTSVIDLAPLAHSPLRELNLEGCTDLVDLKPLLEIKSLETVLIPAHCRDIEYLREHPGIKRLSFHKLTQPVYEFWEEWDRKNAKPAAAEEKP